MDKALVEKIICMSEEIYPDILLIRNRIHSHPELSEKEINTEKLIEDELDKLDIPYISDIGGHGVAATILGDSDQPAVGIRADIDALPIDEHTDTPYRSCCPGVMHACGHDIHTAILLGTARILAQLKNEIPGTVKLFFQPAEETVGGAKPMIDEGCLDNPKVSDVLGIHVNPMLDTGTVQFSPDTVNATSTEFKVTLNGKGCHGAHPEGGIDTIVMACTIIDSIQTIVSRRVSPLEPALITVGQIHGGTKNNIVAGTTWFSGIIRALNEDTKKFIKESLKNMAEKMAESFGGTAEVEFADSYPALTNDEHLLKTVSSSLTDALGQERISTVFSKSMGADDFAYFCHSSKGLYFDIGCHRPGSPDYYPLHSDRFDPDPECIKTGIIAEVIGALSVLEEERHE